MLLEIRIGIGSVSTTSSFPTTAYSPQSSLPPNPNRVLAMASLFCNVYAAGISHGRTAAKPRRMVAARAEAINPDIRKNEDKVVDSVVAAELAKPITPYCRCWRSGTFPLCDGSHVKHNKATGDNVGPLLLKKQ